MIDTFRSVNAAAPLYFLTVFSVLGCMIGSFLNVVILRLPTGVSLMRRSRCKCGAAIPWYFNLPVLGWLMLRGRANCCNRSISFRYPAIELLTGTLFLAAWLLLPTALAIPTAGFFAALVVVAVTDLDTLEIPDQITLWGTIILVCGSGLIPWIHGQPAGVSGGVRAIFSAAGGAIIGSGLILWIGLVGETLLRREAMGFGDVKLVGFIGAFLGWPGAIFTVFTGAVVAILWIAMAQIWRIGGGDPSSFLPSKDASGNALDSGAGGLIPFGPPLCVAAIAYALVGRDYFELWSLQLLHG